MSVRRGKQSHGKISGRISGNDVAGDRRGRKIKKRLQAPLGTWIYGSKGKAEGGNSPQPLFGLWQKEEPRTIGFGGDRQNDTLL